MDLRTGAGVRLTVAVWVVSTIHSHTLYAEAGTHKLLITEIRAEKTLHSMHGDTIRRLGSGEHI